MGIPQDIAALRELVDAVGEELDSLGVVLNAQAVATTNIMERVMALEAYVVRNDNRITQIEAFMAEHEAGRLQRQRDVDQLQASARRLRWQQRTGRQA